MRLIATILMSIALAACGGGGGASAPTSAPLPTSSAPTVTSADTASVVEGGIAVLDIATNDSDGDTVTLTLAGIDASLFTLTGNALGFTTAPDFEAPGSAASSNTYSLTLNASDGTNTTAQDITVSVTDAIEGRVIVGPVSGAKVFIDLNSNLLQDADEPSVLTDTDGYFKLPIVVAADGQTLKLVSIGGTDTSIGKELPHMMLFADAPSAGRAVIIKPVSTILAAATTPAAKTALWTIIAADFGYSGSAEDFLSMDVWALAIAGDETAKGIQKTNRAMSAVFQTAVSLIGTSDPATASANAACATNAIAKQVFIQTLAGIDIFVPAVMAASLEQVVIECAGVNDPALSLSTEGYASISRVLVSLTEIIVGPGDPTNAEAISIASDSQVAFQAAVTAVAESGDVAVFDAAMGGVIPVITAFSSTDNTITVGDSADLTPYFTSGIATIDNGIGTISNGVATTVTPAATTTYSLTVTNNTGTPFTRSTEVEVVAAPTIASLTSTAGTISRGDSVDLMPDFANGEASINANGVTSVTSNVAITLTPTVTKTYTLVVTNAAGAQATEAVAVTVVPVPTIADFSSTSTTITLGDSADLTPSFTDGTASIDNGVGPVTAGVATTVTPTTTTTYTLTATNDAGTTVTSTVEVTVLAVPTTADFRSTATTITRGSSVSLTPYFTNGSASIDNGVGAVTTGVAIVVTPTATTTYTLTVTNADGTVITKNIEVEVFLAPTITSLTFSTNDDGSTGTLTPVFDYGTATIDNGVGTVTTGSPVTLAMDTTTTYTLTVTNAAGATVTTSLEVAVVDVPIITAFTSTATTITLGDSVDLTADFTGGVLASINPLFRPVKANVATTVTPTKTTSYTLLVTNAVGTEATRSIVVTVVAVPTIAAFTSTSTTVYLGESADLTPVFTDGAASIDNGVGTVTTNVPITVTPKATTTYTLTATNAAVRRVTSTIKVVVVPVPKTATLISSATTITRGDSVSLFPFFTNGSAKIDNGVGAVKTGVAIGVTPTATTTYTLTVTATDGTLIMKNIKVVVVPAPKITSLTSSSSTIIEGEKSTLESVFVNGSATIDKGVGAVTTGVPVTIRPSTTTTYTLTVTNTAARTVTQTIEVIVVPTLTGFFTDSVVEGLDYQTATQSGVTSALGAFTYVKGETITFSIGKFPLGDTVDAKEAMNPLDLTAPSLSLPTTNGEVNLLNLKSRDAVRPFGEGIKFAKFQNVLMFLQALDSDKDVSNGINIASGMESIFTDYLARVSEKGAARLDFEAAPAVFRSSFAFRNILGDALSNGYISNSFITSPGYALGHYYEEQGIKTSFTLPGTIRVEDEEDFSLLNVTTYTYDTNGNALTYNQDNYVDASARIISATYDTNGNLLTRERGNEITTFTYNETVYDANGNWLTIASDANGDDYPDQLYTASWKQNGVMASEGSQGASLKNSNSLNPDFMSTFTHGPNGDRLTLITESGGTRRQSTFTYDRILDGVSFVDPRREFFIGNPQNNLLTWALDKNINGVYTYDKSGNMLTDTSYADRSGVDRIITYTYDRNNNRLTKTVGKNTIQTWTYDAIGNPLTLSNDSEQDRFGRMAGDGEVDIIFTYTYDSNGNLLAESVDSDADGVGDFNTTYTYDANGNLLSLLTDEISSEITIYTNLDSKIIRLIDSTRSDIYSEPPIF